jgi:hypothetical protein
MLDLRILILATLILSILCFELAAQDHHIDTTSRFREKIKKGWNVGPIPAVSYDTDEGLLYGVIGNIYQYGDGSIYPRYKHGFTFEWSRTTKGSGKNQLTYDSEFLIPSIRLSAEACLLTEQAMDFYGFNGYEAPYNPSVEQPGNVLYVSKEYYRYERRITRFKVDLMGNIYGRQLRWLAGIAQYNVHVGTVDIDKMNKGKSDPLPQVPLLYDKFVSWGFIPDNQKNGGINNLLKVGVVYDTRDNEPNPMKGIWDEALIVDAPGLLQGSRFSYTKAVFTHRQYFTLKKEVLNFAYRLSYQPKISGNIPFYMLSVLYNTTTAREGLGGSKSLRGILRNRIVGDDIFLGNVELRWKFWRFHFFNQNFYGAVAGFSDFGRVTGNYNVSSTVPEASAYLAQGSAERWHTSYGVGFYGAMNQNFVVSMNYGIASNSNDGTNGLYIGLDFLF